MTKLSTGCICLRAGLLLIPDFMVHESGRGAEKARRARAT